MKEHLGATLVIIEHNMALVTAMSDRVVAMASGRLLVEGRPDEVLGAPAVAQAYLGQPAMVAPG